MLGVGADAGSSDSPGRPAARDVDDVDAADPAPPVGEVNLEPLGGVWEVEVQERSVMLQQDQGKGDCNGAAAEPGESGRHRGGPCGAA